MCIHLRVKDFIINALKILYIFIYNNILYKSDSNNNNNNNNF